MQRIQTRGSCRSGASRPHLYESVARSVVGDGEAQSVLGFKNFYLLLDSFNVGEDEILQADLAPQQLVHVDLVGVQGAEHDLCQDIYKYVKNMF